MKAFQKKVWEKIIKDKWSIHDNIAHLAGCQPIFIDRIQAILLNDEASFESYVAEYDEEFPAWRNMETVELFEHLYWDR